MKRFLLSGIFIFLFSNAALSKEQLPYVSMPVSGPEEAFRYELSLVVRRMLDFGGTRFSIIKNINDSYQLTAEAIIRLIQERDTEGAVAVLQDAAKKFKGNRLAHLLLGYAFERSGRRNEAIRSYSDFYRYSLSLSPMESRLMSSSSLKVFQDYVKLRFREWNQVLPEPKVSLRIHGGRSLVKLETSRAGQWINLILPFVVVGGFVWIIVQRIIDIGLPPVVSYFLFRFHLLAVFAYLVWTAHFFLGVPFLGSLETEFLLFFISGFSLIVIFYALSRFLAYRQEGRIEGTKKCRHCKTVILKVARECPKCHMDSEH